MLGIAISRADMGFFYTQRSKYPTFEVSGLKHHEMYAFGGPENLDIGYLDPLGYRLEPILWALRHCLYTDPFWPTVAQSPHSNPLPLTLKHPNPPNKNKSPHV